MLVLPHINSEKFFFLPDPEEQLRLLVQLCDNTLPV